MEFLFDGIITIVCNLAEPVVKSNQNENAKEASACFILTIHTTQHASKILPTEKLFKPVLEAASIPDYYMLHRNWA